jgi:hypothetical protein
MHGDNLTPSVDAVAQDTALRAKAYEAGKQAYAEWDRTSRNEDAADAVWHAALLWAVEAHCSPLFARGYVGAINGRPYIHELPDRALSGAFAVAWPAFRQGWCCTADGYGDSPEQWRYFWCGEQRGWSWP